MPVIVAGSPVVGTLCKPRGKTDTIFQPVDVLLGRITAKPRWCVESWRGQIGWTQRCLSAMQDFEFGEGSAQFSPVSLLGENPMIVTEKFPRRCGGYGDITRPRPFGAEISEDGQNS